MTEHRNYEIGTGDHRAIADTAIGIAYTAATGDLKFVSPQPATDHYFEPRKSLVLHRAAPIGDVPGMVEVLTRLGWRQCTGFLHWEALGLYTVFATLDEHRPDPDLRRILTGVPGDEIATYQAFTDRYRNG